MTKEQEKLLVLMQVGEFKQAEALGLDYRVLVNEYNRREDARIESMMSKKWRRSVRG